MKPRLTSSWLVLLILSIFNARQAAGLAQGVSFTTNAYSVGGNPTCVVAADANGDGKLDLISANYAGGILKLLTNNGNGGFGYNATFAVGQGPACVIAADVNGDGKFDLISANFGPPTISTNTLTILTNNGSGVFGSNATLAVGSGPFRVAVADVNGDGKPDLISANYVGRTLTVLTNNGNGIFGFNVTLFVGNGPAYSVVADVNNDGKLDLISADNSSSTLTVLINTTIFPGPLLNIVSTADQQVTLSWPATTTNWTLESITNLSTTNWIAVTNVTSIAGSVTLSNTLPSVFFRLKTQ